MTAAVTTDTTSGRPRVTVDVWSDVVCPWCYIGKRRFERAVAELDGEIDVDVRYRPYQLDPTASPGKSQPVFEAYAKKFGGPQQAQIIIDRVTETAAADGIEFRMDRALRANTLLAHRLLWWAEQPGSPVAQADLKERLLQAYFVDGRDVGTRTRWPTSPPGWASSATRCSVSSRATPVSLRCAATWNRPPVMASAPCRRSS